MFGWTWVQEKLALRGWDNQGNGSTMAALAGRGLITQSSRPTTMGVMRTVALTREGRAAAKAGARLPAVPKAALGRRSWEVLTFLWNAAGRGEPLKWGHSTTIENVLIDKHIPPLARQVPGGYEITERGKDFYREHYAAHTAAHPDVRAPHPDGEAAEPWPPAVDETLDAHSEYHKALRTAWLAARDSHIKAEREATAPGPEPAPLLPDAVTAMAAARHQLWQQTARQRADLAAAHADDLNQRVVRAARAYAIVALTAFNAAVAGAPDLLTDLIAPGESDDWDEQRVTPPAQTGIHVIDDEAKKLHAAAVGTPRKRRGPAPKHRKYFGERASGKASAAGSALVALADFLHEHMRDGALLRRLHPTLASRTVLERAPNASKDPVLNSKGDQAC